MITAHPTPRLRNAEAGQQITLTDQIGPRQYIVHGIRDDGYYELSIGGEVKVIASPGHLIERLK